MTGDLIGSERACVILVALIKATVSLPMLPASQQALKPASVSLPHLGDVYLHPEWDKNRNTAPEKKIFFKWEG